MNRLFVSAALLPLVWAAAAQAETKITTAVTAPVRTSTATTAGTADDLTIDTTGSVQPTAAGAAVTLDSNNKVSNLGAIAFTGVNGATGVLVLGGRTGSVSNGAAISLLEDYTATDTDGDGDLDGPLAQGANRFGVRVTGPDPFTGDIRNETAGSITVEGNDSAGVSVETRLNGSLVNAGSISVIGDRSVGVQAQSVAGDVSITGSVTAQGQGATAVRLGDVDGQLVLQSAVTATGYRSTDRLADAARAKLDADDLLQGGAAVRVTGNVGRGILLDRPPADLSTTDTDEDKDGIPDASEGTASIVSAGAAPALDLGSNLATTIGVVGTGVDAFGLVNRGSITGAGVNDGVAAIAVRIGQAGGGTTTVVGGISNSGGTIGATAYGAEATAILVNPGAVVASLRNSGTIIAAQTGGANDARAVVDKSGSLGLVENTGIIQATVGAATGVTITGRSVAIDLSANTSGAIVRQAKANADGKPAIAGDVLLGSGDDRVELLGGTLRGALAFGAGADSLLIDGGGDAAGRFTDTDGRLSVEVREGRLAITNLETVQLTSLSLGAKSVLGVTLDPTAPAAPRLQVSGAATIASGAEIDLSLASLLKTAGTFELVRAGTLQVGLAGVSLVGAPFLYDAALRTDAATNALVADIKPKTAAELGLNRSGSQAYGAVFAALDKDPRIETAVLAQTTKEGFQSLYSQMLPDHSGGALMSAAAISGAISQAVGQPLVHDGRGGTGAWAQEIMFHVDRNQDQAAGYRTNGYGLAAGAELVGQANAVGVNASLVTAEFKDQGAATGERVVMNFTEAGAYWRLRAGAFQADARGGLGYAWFDSDRRLVGAGLDLTSSAKWGGWIADAHAGAAYELGLGRFYARPELSLDYLRLSEGGYQEKGGGTGFDLKVDQRKGDLLTGQALVALGWQFGDEYWWRPELKAGWRQRLAGDAGRTTASFQGGEAFTLDPETAFKGGAVARLGLVGGTGQLYVGINAGATVDHDYSEYDLRGTIRVRF
ncbi:MAG: autotransporter [Phenylobacterium sp.]|nr:autotransporter [Phenylobacterium sp.]